MGKKEEESDQPWKGRDRAPIPGFVFLGIFGAAAATAASGRWRKPVEWFYNQLWRSGYYFRYGSGFQSSGRKERAWARYRRRIQEMEEDERERVERIRRMQEVFNRERNKSRKGPEAWTNHGAGSGWHQEFQRDDWYYKTESSNDNQQTKYRSTSNPKSSTKSHHYTILGLDRYLVKTRKSNPFGGENVFELPVIRYKTEPYSDAEIKTAFRQKALEFHPDRNRNNSATAEAKFKEVVASYEAIQLERKRGAC